MEGNHIDFKNNFWKNMKLYKRALMTYFKLETGQTIFVKISLTYMILIQEE